MCRRVANGRFPAGLRAGNQMSVKPHEKKMANLGKKNGVYVARFRLEGKEYKKSLKTSDPDQAAAAFRRVEDTLHWLGIHHLVVPAGVDPGDFVLSGGTLTTPIAEVPEPTRPSLSALMGEYRDNLAHMADSHRSTIAVHLRTLSKKLKDKADLPVDQIEHRDLERFLQIRLGERSHTTVCKERGTVVKLFDWIVLQGHLASSPAARLTKIKTGGNLPPFRTVEEIDAILVRGGLSKEEQWALWDCLYLSPAEITGVLALVHRRAREEVSFILHAIPAYTGMRRGEVLRLTWADIEFEQDSLIARSKKQSRQAVETKRRIDLHPELKAILLDWQKQRPRGQYVACDDDNLLPLTANLANKRFWQPLRGTEWCLSSRRNRFKVTFHVYRHSFASNLAAAGIDQRVIDEWMGHQTEAMRKRYRHLYPRTRRSAIESFSLAPKQAPAAESTAS